MYTQHKHPAFNAENFMPHIDPAMTDQALGIKAAESLLRSCTSGQVRYQQPAPHGVIDDCFDPASLAAIQKHFPSLDEMQRTPSRSPAHRTTMPLADGKLGPSGLPDLCHSAAEFWGAFQQKLDCPDFRSQLSGAISNADQCRGQHSRLWPMFKTLLVRDCDGYKTGPYVMLEAGYSQF